MSFQSSINSAIGSVGYAASIGRAIKEKEATAKADVAEKDKLQANIDATAERSKARQAVMERADAYRRLRETEKKQPKIKKVETQPAVVGAVNPVTGEESNLPPTFGYSLDYGDGVSIDLDPMQAKALIQAKKIVASKKMTRDILRQTHRLNEEDNDGQR